MANCFFFRSSFFQIPCRQSLFLKHAVSSDGFSTFIGTQIFLNIMILAMVHLIGHLHFINFNQKTLANYSFHRIHFLDVNLIVIINSSQLWGNPYLSPQCISLFQFHALPSSLPTFFFSVLFFTSSSEIFFFSQFSLFSFCKNLFF